MPDEQIQTVDALTAVVTDVKKKLDELSGLANRVSTLEVANGRLEGAFGNARQIVISGIGIAVIASLVGYLFNRNDMASYKEKVEDAKREADGLKRTVDDLKQEAAKAQAVLKDILDNKYPKPLPHPPGERPPVSADRRKLVCTTKDATSDTKTYPSVNVVLSSDEQKDYAVTGGGCKTLRAGDGAAHNIPTIRSTPVPNGWSCAAGDPPNLPVDSRITAYLIACALR